MGTTLASISPAFDVRDAIPSMSLAPDAAAWATAYTLVDRGPFFSLSLIASISPAFDVRDAHSSDVNGLDMDYPDIYPDIQWISRIKF